MILVDAIAIVESANRLTPGDNGKAISVFQIHEAFWLDVKQKYPQADIGENWQEIGQNTGTARIRARICASLGIEMIKSYLRDHAQEQSPTNIYACYNLGRDAFRKCRFDILNCPIATRTKADRIEKLLMEKRSPPTTRHD